MEQVALPWLQPTPLRVPPAVARGLDAAAQERAGARPGLLRLSVGVEPAELLWADLRHALDGLR